MNITIKRKAEEKCLADNLQKSRRGLMMLAKDILADNPYSPPEDNFRYWLIVYVCEFYKILLVEGEVETEDIAKENILPIHLEPLEKAFHDVQEYVNKLIDNGYM